MSIGRQTVSEILVSASITFEHESCYMMADSVQIWYEGVFNMAIILLFGTHFGRVWITLSAVPILEHSIVN